MEQELLLPPEEAVNVLGALYKTADFRTTIKYNNWLYALAGRIVEQTSGMPLETFMQTHFFQPLGLERTTFAEVAGNNYASCHIILSDGTPFEVSHPEIGSGKLMAGAAGMKSSLTDLLRIYGSILAAVAGQKQTGLTTTPGNPFKQTVMAFASHNKKGITDMPGALSSVHVIPESQTAIVVLGDTLAFADLPDYVGGMMLETILQSKEATEFLPLVLEAKNASLQGPLKIAEKLKVDRKSRTSHKPLGEYKRQYINTKKNFLLVVKIHGDGLRMNVQRASENILRSAPLPRRHFCMGLRPRRRGKAGNVSPVV
ncbi:beta-lactamase/transpeptidase-like protein [Cadophora sp. DSE1049]|nr:beta-lactamase/transpeptidase-like protein [Cadophora sp. DSE1049]